MNDLEQLLRATLAEHAAAAPDAEALLARLSADPAPTRRTWRPLVAAVAALVLIGTGVLVAVRRDGSRDSLVSPPAGDTQIVSYHGVEVTVPAYWKLNDYRCSSPAHDTVVTEGIHQMCLTKAVPGLTVVELKTTDDLPPARTAIEPQPHGPTRESSVDPDGRFREILFVPAVHMRVSVISPARDRALALLATVRRVDVDTAGCSTAGSLLPLGQQIGSDRALVPGNPVVARLCRYDNGWMEHSAALTEAERDQLVAILNGLPEGHTLARSSMSSIACQTPPRRGFKLEFKYGSGPSEIVVVTIGACQHLTATNGVRTTKVYGELTKFLLDRVGYDDGFDPAAEDRQPTEAGARALCERALPELEVSSATPALVGDLRDWAIGPGVQPAKDAWPGIDKAANGAWCWTTAGPKAYGVYAVGPDATYVKFAVTSGMYQAPSGPPMIP